MNADIDVSNLKEQGGTPGEWRRTRAGYGGDEDGRRMVTATEEGRRGTRLGRRGTRPGGRTRTSVKQRWERTLRYVFFSLLDFSLICDCYLTLLLFA